MNKPTGTRPNRVRFERSYEADVRDLWELWTTKEGFESWWGPVGFRVEVHKLDARLGGELMYDMIADAPEQIEYMRKSNRPLSHSTRGTFTELTPLRSLELCHIIDFIPGVKPYENRMTVELSSEGKTARMVVTLDPHFNEEFTRLSRMGFESQLTKVPAALQR